MKFQEPFNDIMKKNHEILEKIRTSEKKLQINLEETITTSEEIVNNWLNSVKI